MRTDQELLVRLLGDRLIALIRDVPTRLYSSLDTLYYLTHRVMDLVRYLTYITRRIMCSVFTVVSPRLEHCLSVFRCPPCSTCM